MEKKKILLVEDEGLVALELTRRLQRFGYEVPAAAASSEEALAQEKDMAPDLILMDIRIQGPLDGVDVALAVRARRDVPVVFLTAHSDRATLERAKTVAPYGYVLKPCRDRELQVVIDMALSKHQIEAQSKLLLANLQECVARVRKLSGILPICAHCKKIRNDREEWETVEAYIERHSEAEFSHGICPVCAKEFFPEQFSRREKTAKASGGEP